MPTDLDNSKFNNDFVSIIFMVIVNFILLVVLSIRLYMNHSWDTKTLKEEVDESLPIGEAYDIKARQVFFLNAESAQESLLMQSQFRDQSTILTKRKKQSMPELDFSSINRPSKRDNINTQRQWSHNGHNSDFIDTLILHDYGKTLMRLIS